MTSPPFGPPIARRVVSVSGRAGEEIALNIEGTAFLKHMVRNIAGTLVEVGKGRREAGWVKEALESKDRRLSGPTAPAHGLTLIEVLYPSAADTPAGEGEEQPEDDELA